jgi:hypothetical protein
MKKNLLMLAIMSLFVASCDSKTSPSDTAQGAPKSVDSAKELTADMPLEKSSSDNCGSLKHLLLLLPTQKEVHKAPEIFRGCQGSDAQVELSFSTSSDPFYEYHYSVLVLSGDSTYAESRVNLEGASPEQTSFMRSSVTTIGQEFRAQFDICKNYVLNPMVPDGRNPVIKSAKGLEVCFTDNMDANKEIWNAYAIYDNKVGLKLELTGSKAAALLTTEDAAQHLLPLFEQFNIGVALQ